MPGAYTAVVEGGAASPESHPTGFIPGLQESPEATPRWAGKGLQSGDAPLSIVPGASGHLFLPSALRLFSFQYSDVSKLTAHIISQ